MALSHLFFNLIVVEGEEFDEAENMHFSEVPDFMAEEAEAAEMEIEDDREEFEEHNNILQAPIFWTGHKEEASSFLFFSFEFTN